MQFWLEGNFGEGERDIENVYLRRGCGAAGGVFLGGLRVGWRGGERVDGRMRKSLGVTVTTLDW